MSRSTKCTDMAVASLVSSFCWLSAGCTALIVPATPPTALPPELEVVVMERGKFAFDRSESLAVVAPGTELDAVGDVSGCWGSASFSTFMSSARPVAGFYWAIAFEGATSTYRSYVLSESYLLEPIVIVGVASGSYVFEGAHTLVLHETETSLLDPFTGETTAPDQFAERTMEFQFTRQADRIRLHFGAPDREPVDPGDDEIYTRFDCPAHAD